MSAVVKSFESAERSREAAVRARPCASAQTPGGEATRLPYANDLRTAAGNFAVQRLLRGRAMQTKLAVSAPGDAYEQEADRVADTVMSMTAARPGVAPQSHGGVGPGSVQRKCACEEKAGGSCEQCREKELSLQRRAAGHDAASAPPQSHDAAPKVQEALRSGGQPLDAAARSFFEPRFGRDLSRVRVHSDAKATASAQSVNALAYTVGSDIVFGSGQYDSGSQAGRRLLAHELAHVVQQDFGGGPGGGAPASLIQRQPPAGDGATAAPGDSAEPATPADPNAPPAQLPPQHAERVEHLAEMKEDIDEDMRQREELQQQYRALPPDATGAQRENLKGELTHFETNIETEIQARIDLTTEAIQDLENLLPGSSPSPPKPAEPTPNSSTPDGPQPQSPQKEEQKDEQKGEQKGEQPAGGPTVQSELTRLYREREEDQAQLGTIKRCLARKRIKQIKTEIEDPELSLEDRQKLLDEKAEKEKYINTTTPPPTPVDCRKSPSETKHPTEVSRREFELLKKGEHCVPTPYVAEEGKPKKGDSAEVRKKKAEKGTGCTIGYGHVIRPGKDPVTSCHQEFPPGEDYEKAKETNWVPKTCVTDPPWSLICPDGGEDLLTKDIAGKAAALKKEVLVDLTEDQFDALIDISLHHGSLDPKLRDTVNSKLCWDDEAVRQEYLKTNLTVDNRSDMGPKVFEKRRMERVWKPQPPPSEVEDPNCI